MGARRSAHGLLNVHAWRLDARGPPVQLAWVPPASSRYFNAPSRHQRDSHARQAIIAATAVSDAFSPGAGATSSSMASAAGALTHLHITGTSGPVVSPFLSSPQTAGLPVPAPSAPGLLNAHQLAPPPPIASIPIATVPLMPPLLQHIEEKKRQQQRRGREAPQGLAAGQLVEGEEAEAQALQEQQLPPPQPQQLELVVKQEEALRLEKQGARARWMQVVGVCATASLLMVSGGMSCACCIRGQMGEVAERLTCCQWQQW